MVLPPGDLTDEDLEDPHYFGDLDLVNMSDETRDELLREADDRLAEIERRNTPIRLKTTTEIREKL